MGYPSTISIGDKCHPSLIGAWEEPAFLHILQVFDLVQRSRPMRTLPDRHNAQSGYSADSAFGSFPIGVPGARLMGVEG